MTKRKTINVSEKTWRILKLLQIKLWKTYTLGGVVYYLIRYMAEIDEKLFEGINGIDKINWIEKYDFDKLPRRE